MNSEMEKLDLRQGDEDAYTGTALSLFLSIRSTRSGLTEGMQARNFSCHCEEMTGSKRIPINILLTSLAFLE